MEVYQGFAQIALMRLYGATSTEGLAFGIVSWVMNYGVALVVGGLYLVLEMRHGLRWSDAADQVVWQKRRGNPKRIVILLSCVEFSPEEVQGTWNPLQQM